MKKVILLIALAFMFIGCTDKETDTRQAKFVDKYGSSDVYVCENGFLVNRYFFRYSEKTMLITNDAGIPTRCGNAEIKTYETVATGGLSGSVTVKGN